MGLIARNTGGGDFELPPTGMQVARCWRVVDLGTVKGEYMGKPKVARKCLIGWELLSAKREDGEPFTIGNRYTISLGEKANLRSMLESWRGRAFTAQELEGFDLTHILGKPCLINVVHKEEGDKTYANIAAVTPLPAGMTARNGVLNPYIFSLVEFDEPMFKGLSEKLQDGIAQSPEYRALKSGKPAASAGTTGGVDDDDIPF
jgi:hypothetical protein